METSATSILASVSASKRFIINFFGESGSGKTTVLCRLIEMLRLRAKYNLEVADGFLTRDRKAMLWYRSGRKYSGAVCVCTSGDTAEIIRENISFFQRHFDVVNGNTPWHAWCDAIRDGDPPLSQEEVKSTQMHQLPIGILVTASRKPLRYYRTLPSLSDYNCLDVPILVNAWHGLNGSNNASCDWMNSLLVPAEVLLVHVNYILHNGCFKSYASAKGYRVSMKAMRSSISRDN